MPPFGPSLRGRRAALSSVISTGTPLCGVLNQVGRQDPGSRWRQWSPKAETPVFMVRTMTDMLCELFERLFFLSVSKGKSDSFKKQATCKMPATRPKGRKVVLKTLGSRFRFGNGWSCGTEHGVSGSRRLRPPGGSRTPCRWTDYCSLLPRVTH